VDGVKAGIDLSIAGVEAGIDLSKAVGHDIKSGVDGAINLTVDAVEEAGKLVDEAGKLVDGASPRLASPCLVLPCPALPCPALPCLALPCLALPCLALPCLALSGIALCCRAARCKMRPPQVALVLILLRVSVAYASTGAFDEVRKTRRFAPFVY
jgi:hypothetical protein